jgi:hypothetical protein
MQFIFGGVIIDGVLAKIKDTENNFCCKSCFNYFCGLPYVNKITAAFFNEEIPSRTRVSSIKTRVLEKPARRLMLPAVLNCSCYIIASYIRLKLKSIIIRLYNELKL